MTVPKSKMLKSNYMKKENFLKIFVAFTYLAMIIVNALANIIPINGNNTGQVSNSYPNLFAPSALTFSIWGVIYFFLAAYTLYQFGFFQKDKGKKHFLLFAEIGTYFALTSLANIFWIFSWHYHFIAFSLLFMLIILFYLIKIGSLINQQKFSLKEKFFIKAPFSLYFGWITVATIANVTTYLVSLNWNAWGISPAIWTVIILIVGALIGLFRTLFDKNILYGLVFVWAYFGIWLKHTSATGFGGQYPSIINTLIVLLVLFLISLASLVFKKFKKKS